MTARALVAAAAALQLAAAAPVAHAASEPAPGEPAQDTVTRIVEVVPEQLRLGLVVLGALAIVLAAISALAGLRVRRAEQQRRLLAADVGVLQSALLPPVPSRVGSADVSVAYRPADGPAAGGDFYDVFALPGDRTAVIVGDVTGHGRDALSLTTLVRYAIRARLEAGLSARLAVQAAGDALAPQLQGRLVTVVAAIYDPLVGYLTYASAGHPQPVLADGLDPVTVGSSPPLGAGVRTGLREVTVALPPGRTACFTTDGLLDARTREGRLGPAGLERHVGGLGPEYSAADVIEPVVAGRLGQTDDVAVVVLRPLAGASGPVDVRVETFEVDAKALPRAVAFMRACGVDPETTVRAVDTARAAVRRHGAAIVEVSRSAATTTVTVLPPETAGSPDSAGGRGRFARDGGATRPDGPVADRGS